jgi:hypothetical protein
MGMNLGTTGSCGALRRFTACILVVALVLQGIAFTLAAARPAADPVGAPDSAGFELCSHGGGTASGGAPESPAADSHCIFCLAGAAYVGAPAAALEFHTITFAVLSWPFHAWRLPAVTVNASALPRGPPLAA